jgi:hypothetical protein
LPEATPPGLNYSVLIGRLTADPWLGRNPVGEPVTLLRIEYPVVDPERPQVLWTWASCEIEVSDALAERYDIRSLEGGDSILAAGQLSERWTLLEGRVTRRATIVATLVHPEPPLEPDEPPIPGSQP